MASFKNMIQIPTQFQIVGTCKLRRSYTTEQWRLLFVEAGTRFLFALRQLGNVAKFLQMSSASSCPKPGVCHSSSYYYCYYYYYFYYYYHYYYYYYYYYY